MNPMNQLLHNALRAPVWRALMAVLAIGGLLLAFHQVVSGAVQQSELRRRADASQAQAAWLCNAMQGAQARDRCRQHLNAPQAGPAAMQAQNMAEGNASP